MNIGNFIFLRRKRVELGEGFVIQYTLFEHKKLGGIWFYGWEHVGGDNDQGQCRFHTHAFNSICFTLKGSYRQEVIVNGVKSEETVKKLFRPRLLKRNYTHRIIKAEPKTVTCVIFGRWMDHWYEYFEDSEIWVKYTWGREVLSKSKEMPNIIKKS